MSVGLYSNLPGTGVTPGPSSPTSPTPQHKPRMSITSAPEVSFPTLPSVPEHHAPEPLIAGPVICKKSTMTIAEAPKKKYAKETWHGKKSTPSLLI